MLGENICWFPKAAYDLLCSLTQWKVVVNSLYLLSVIPSTIVSSSTPGETTSISRMFLHAVHGFDLNALCIVVDTDLPANARKTALLNQTKRIKKLLLFARAYCMLFEELRDLPH